MTPAAYYDWWFYSGICAGDPTRPANHAALCERLSAPGVHLIILWELLLDNAGFSDTSYITETDIEGARKRIEEAARAVGATQLADYLATLPDPSVVPETHRELKALLKQFAARRKAELAADIARHGDPRASPGFDKRQAKRKRDEQWGENSQRYQYSDRIAFFRTPLQQLRAFLATGLTLQEVCQKSEEMAHLAACLQYDFPRWAQMQQPADVTQFLEECRLLATQFPGQLPPWPAPAASDSEPPPSEVSQDRAILEQLQAIGPYSVIDHGSMTAIHWDVVKALANDLAPVGLRFHYEGEFPALLLTAWPDAQRRFFLAMQTMTRELLRIGRVESERIGDAELRPDDEQVLSQVVQGTLVIADEMNKAGMCRVECSWEVEWDPEHGCAFEIDERGGVLRVE